MFDRQILSGVWQPTSVVTPTEDLTSTAICVLGATRYRLDPASIGMDTALTMKALATRAAESAYTGGFGLVAWANAVTDGPPIEELARRCGIDLTDTARHLVGLTTMETAWLTSALAHEVARGNHQSTSALLVAADELRHLRFQPSVGLMAHASDAAEDRSLRFRRWVSNFADQIYSVQALAFTTLVTGDNAYVSMADTVASTLVAMQGDQGQWWWHYDAKRGGSPQPYSVYSVHQHGMAPMALWALEKAGGTPHPEARRLSLDWLTDNELGVPMVQTGQPATIWRSIDADDTRLQAATRKLGSLVGRPSQRPPLLKLNRETRPYEWAWCLYAAAIEASHPAGGHLA